MKRIIFTLCLLTAFNCTYADSYFSLGNNDTVYVYPNIMADNIAFPVHAHFNGYVDQWSIIFNSPQGMTPRGITTGPDMYITYTDITGTEATLVAPMTIYYDYTQVSSHILIYGYWDYNGDGVLEPYGTVKWDAGDYNEMVDVTFQFDASFTGGTLTMTGAIKSGPDTRQNVVNPNPTPYTRNITVIVGYRPGDVNGDGVLNSADITAMIAYILGNITDWDQYQIAAADLNGDGYVNVTDVNILNHMILYA